MDISQASTLNLSRAALQWTYRRPDSRVYQGIGDGDVEHGLMGVLS